jgi:hypothetical protein
MPTPPISFDYVSFARASTDALSCLKKLVRSLNESREKTIFPDRDGDIYYATGADRSFIRINILAPVLVPLFAGFLIRDDECPYQLRQGALRLICGNYTVQDIVALVTDMRANEDSAGKLEENLSNYESCGADDENMQKALHRSMKKIAPMLGQEILKASLSTASKTWSILKASNAEIVEAPTHNIDFLNGAEAMRFKHRR